jgi:low temperature requirement protein LtrA
MRKSWLWLFITLALFIVGFIVGGFLAAGLGFNPNNPDAFSTTDRLLVILVSQVLFVLLPAIKMFVEARKEQAEGLSIAPVLVAGALIFYSTFSVVGALITAL